MEMLKQFAPPVAAFDTFTDPCASFLEQMNALLSMGMYGLDKYGTAKYADQYYGGRGMDPRSVDFLASALRKRVDRLSTFYDIADLEQTYVENFGW